MPNKCITTNLPPHQYLRGGGTVYLKKTQPRNGVNKIFDRSHMGMGYASFKCLVAPIANSPICIIFDTYFPFYFWSNYYFGGQNSLEIFQNWIAWSPTHDKSMYNHCWSHPSKLFFCPPFQTFQKYSTPKMA